MHSNALFCNWNAIVIWFFCWKVTNFHPWQLQVQPLESNTHVSSTSRMIWGIIHICSTNAAGVMHQSWIFKTGLYVNVEVWAPAIVKHTYCSRLAAGSPFALLGSVLSSWWSPPLGMSWVGDASSGVSFSWFFPSDPGTAPLVPVLGRTARTDGKGLTAPLAFLFLILCLKETERCRENVREEGRKWGDGRPCHSNGEIVWVSLNKDEETWEGGEVLFWLDMVIEIVCMRVKGKECVFSLLQLLLRVGKGAAGPSRTAALLP